MIFESLSESPQFIFFTDEEDYYDNWFVMDSIRFHAGYIKEEYPDERVIAVHLDNSVDSFILAMSIIYAGKVVMPLFNALPPAILEATKDLAGASMTLNGWDYETYETLPLEERVPGGGIIFSTSGSEGRPSLIEHSYESFSSYPTDIMEKCGFVPGAKILNHSMLTTGGLNVVGLAAAAKSNIIMYEGRPNYERSKGLLPEVDVVLARPPLIEKFLDEDPHAFDNKTIVSSGMVFPVSTQKRLFSSSDNVTLANTYAAVEVGFISCGVSQKPSWNIGVPSTEIRSGVDSTAVWHDAPTWVITPQGRQSIQGWHELNDITMTLDDGKLRFLSRGSEKIKVSGYTVFTNVLEDGLLDIDGVNEVAAVGVDDGPRDQKILVFYSGSATPEKVSEHINQTLPFYYRVTTDRITQLDSIPRNPAGKPIKAALV